MQPVVIRESRTKAALRLLMGAAIALTGTWLLTRERTFPNLPYELYLSAFMVLLVAAFAFKYVIAILRPGRLRISDVGVEMDLGWWRKNCSWDSIQHIYVKRVLNGTKITVLDLKGRQGSVRFYGWTASPAEIGRILHERRPAAA